MDYEKLVLFLKMNGLGLYFKNDPFVLDKAEKVVILNTISDVLLNKLIAEFNEPPEVE